MPTSTTHARRARIGALAGVAGLCLAATTLLPWSPAAADTPGPVPGYDYSKAIRPLAGCETNELPGNDDGYVTTPVGIGFDVNFYGDAFSQLYVNNNGNVTFDAPSSTYVPFPLEDATTHPIIAPYFTDVDTRGPGRTMHYGSGTTSTGQKYFCVDWINVAQYPSSDAQGLDDFQLVLYDTSGAPGGHSGDFAIEFNYDHMPWDHGGNARAGFAAGTGVTGTSLELPGGGTSGAMIDGGPNALVASSANSSQAGRYYFPINGNGIVNTGSFTGTVKDQDGNPVGGATVQACRTNGYCRTGVSSATGAYTVGNLAAGDYALTVSPPNGSGTPAHGTGTLASNTATQTVDLVLQQPAPPPAGTQIGNQNGTSSDGLPVIYWGETHVTTFTGCAGSAAPQVRFDGFHTDGSPYSATVSAVETSAGNYQFTIPRFDVISVHGDLQITYLLGCQPDVDYTIYIDPSGTVVDQNGDPVDGATVTLLTSESVDGTYTAVPNGSTVMSPSNRDNPDTTNAQGEYGWDVTAGYYKVEATKAGCDTVDSDALTIPPAVTGLVLTLTCGTTANQPPTVDAGPDVSGIVGTAIPLAGSATDPDDDPLTYGWTINSTDCTVIDPASAATSVNCTVSGIYTATLTVDDGVNPAVSDTATVTVNNDTGNATCRGLHTTDGVTSSTNPTTGVTTFTGTSGDDVIIATNGPDVIRAGGGNDTVCAGKGDDKVYGAGGDDVLRGQAGNDLVRGQGGLDSVLGNEGTDSVQGNDGDDRVLGGTGDDQVIGGKQTDVCNGGPGTDTNASCETLIGFP